MASTERVKRFAQKRRESGWIYLSAWLSPESSEKLQKYCSRLNVTKAQAIEALLNDKT